MASSAFEKRLGTVSPATAFQFRVLRVFLPTLYVYVYGDVACPVFIGEDGI